MRSGDRCSDETLRLSEINLKYRISVNKIRTKQLDIKFKKKAKIRNKTRCDTK